MRVGSWSTMSSDDPVYRHTQRGDLILVLVGGTCVLLIAISLVTGWHPVTLVVLAVLLATLVLSASLRVEVARDTLSIVFGPGIIRKSWSIDELRAWRVVRNPWWFGWGIHATQDGWLYNVSGSCAVEIELVSGRKARIGTDDPTGFVAALDRVAAGRRTGQFTAAADHSGSGT